jgi:hypothetical protein
LLMAVIGQRRVSGMVHRSVVIRLWSEFGLSRSERHFHLYYAYIAVAAFIPTVFGVAAARIEQVRKHIVR